MAKAQPTNYGSETRSPAQKSTYKDLSRNGQSPADQLRLRTRSPAQKPAYKDLTPQWPKPGHWGLKPLILRFLTALVRALL